MRVTVDRSMCQQHGQCEIAAPHLFRLDDGELSYVEEPADGDGPAAQEAADACPMQAILVED